MQVVENWSHVVGRVEKWTPPKDADDHGELSCGSSGSRR